MSTSWYEATARDRVAALLDDGSFIEFLPPHDRASSPHLKVLGSPAAFDDGIAIGQGTLDGRPVFVAAQEGAFMGGTVGEVHGAKLVGLLERALEDKPDGVLLLLESGGVRLHEANAGLIGVSEVMRAILNLRVAGIATIVLNGGRYGVFGGMGIVSRLCSTVIMSEEGRLGLSGPEVIETTMGVEEFDASDRALVWRTVGGKHRYILGDASSFVADDATYFREAAIRHLSQTNPLDLESIEREHELLSSRMTRFADKSDATEIWSDLGIDQVDDLALMDATEFRAAVDGKRIVA